jgi:hypothetical protein
MNALQTHPHSGQLGFTRVDLIALIVMLGLLLVVCGSAFGRAGMNSKGLRCLNNTRQLTRAWQMYANDSNDKLVYASTDGRGSPLDTNPQNLNNYAWSGAHMDYTPGNRANWDVNIDMTKRPLWPYTGRDASIYKCPEDQSSVQNPSGVTVPRVLSMSMNLYVGGFTGTFGGWDTTIAELRSLRLFLKSTDFTSATPAKIFVFLDQRPDSINWSNFMMDMRGFLPSNPALYAFGDLPGFFHDGGGAFSFADGSGEIHRWQDYRTIPPLAPNGTIASYPLSSPNNPDVAWLQSRSTCPK